ncbi:MAG: GUN4 domain-containing protein [Cyanobacteria bacterium SBLK]|nr:GUN4 domain-containing protein [Cyanobacteria bacterium SBLK]
MSQCPICQTDYIEGEVRYCTTCGWYVGEFSSLLPEELTPEERDRIAWGKRMWSQLQSFSQFKTILKDIQADLSKASQERMDLGKQITRIYQDLIAGDSGIGESSLNLEAEPSVSYTLLEELLIERDWKEADGETARLAIAIAQREKRGFLVETDLDKLPCHALREIDRLWLEATGGKFGLSVQKDLYLSLGGNRFLNSQIWQMFGAKVGWYRGNAWLHYNEIDFSLSAPAGHLPIFGDGLVWFVGGWEGGGQAFSTLISRLTKCY